MTTILKKVLLDNYSKTIDFLTLDENRLQRKVNELATKNEDSRYIIEGKLVEKENEIELMKRRDSENTDAIAALSDQLTRIMDEVIKLKNRN